MAARWVPYWLITLVLIAVLELNALGLMPWKTQPNKGLNMPCTTAPVCKQRAHRFAFGLWAIFLVLTEIFFKF